MILGIFPLEGGCEICGLHVGLAPSASQNLREVSNFDKFCKNVM